MPRTVRINCPSKPSSILARRRRTALYAATYSGAFVRLRNNVMAIWKKPISVELLSSNNLDASAVLKPGMVLRYDEAR